MKLNRTGSNWNELERNKINENWDIIEGGYNDVVGQITDEVVGHLIDSAKLIWKEPVDTYGDLPTNAEVGETRMVRKADPEGISYVYRFDGEKWEKIQEIDVTLVNEVDARLTAQLAETVNNVGIGGSKVEPITTGAITLVTDDGHINDYTIFKDIFASAGIPCTSAVIPAYIERGRQSFATKEQLLELQNEYGWEIVSHSMSNDSLTLMSDSELDRQLRESHEWLKNNGFNGSDFFTIPLGKYDKRVKSYLKRYYKAARASGFGHKGYNELPLDTYSLRSCWFDTNVGSPHYEGFNIRTFDYYKNLIDQAIEKNRWLIISFHSFDYDNWTNDDKNTFNQIVSYAANTGRVKTMQEAYELFYNPIEVGYGKFDVGADKRFAIGKDGSINAGYQFDEKKLNGKSSYIEYEDLKTTVSVIDEPDNDMPTTNRGVLITYKYGTIEPNLFTTQIFMSTEDGNQYIWKRNLARDGTWYTWRPITFYQQAIKARYDYGFSPDTPINDFPIGINENQIDNTHESLSNHPFGAGVLITHRFDDVEQGYNFQEFHPYGSAVIYKRSFQTNGQPRNWVRYGPSQFRVLQINATTPDTPITEFELGITKNAVQGGDLPGGVSAGVMTTIKAHETEHVFNYQEFQASDLKLYKRRFNTSGGFRSWELVSEPIA